MSAPRIIDGWVVVKCDAPSAELVDIGVGNTAEAVEWQPAFRDTVAGDRVAKIRTPEHLAAGQIATFWLRTGRTVLRMSGVRL